ncbi:MAG: hypothetical protein ABC588_05075 [Candidatus Methanosuratincola petrocarbonis]
MSGAPARPGFGRAVGGDASVSAEIGWGERDDWGRIERADEGRSLQLKMVRLRLAGKKPFATRRGTSAACSGAFLAALAGISGDPILAAAGASVLAGSAADLAIMLSRLAKKEKGARAGVGTVGSGGKAGLSLTSIAGEAVDFSVDIEAPGLGEVESFAAETPFEVLGHARIGGGYRVDLQAKPELYGDYALGGIEAVTRSRAGFFGARAALVPAREVGEVGGGLASGSSSPSRSLRSGMSAPRTK